MEGEGDNDEEGSEHEQVRNDNDDEATDVVKAEEVLHETSVLGKTFECCTGRWCREHQYVSRCIRFCPKKSIYFREKEDRASVLIEFAHKDV